MTPKELLDTILGYLGFVVQIDETQSEGGNPTLQIYMEESHTLIGRDGETALRQCSDHHPCNFGVHGINPLCALAPPQPGQLPFGKLPRRRNRLFYRLVQFTLSR